MIRRLIWIVTLALMAPALAEAADPARKAASARPAKTETARPAKADSAGREPEERQDPTKGRRLQDIHIEGEIPVPQVLFITAREQRRVLDFDHQRYRRTSVELARGTAVPKRVTVVKPRPAAAAPPAEGSR